MDIILFDIDGTIMDSGAAGRDAMHMAMKKCFNIEVGTTAQTFAGRTDLSIIYELMELNGVKPDKEKFKKVAEAYLEFLPEQLKVGGPTLLPGVPELLSELKKLGAPLGLLTGNLAAGARIKLEHYSLYDFFSYGGYGDSSMSRNDVASDAFLETKRQFGEETLAENIWILGDTPADVACAKHIGAKVLAVCTGINTREQLEECEPDLVFDDLADTKAVLKVLGFS